MGFSSLLQAPLQYCLLSLKTENQSWGCNSVGEHVLCMHKAMSSISSNTKQTESKPYHFKTCTCVCMHTHTKLHFNTKLFPCFSSLPHEGFLRNEKFLTSHSLCSFVFFFFFNHEEECRERKEVYFLSIQYYSKTLKEKHSYYLT